MCVANTHSEIWSLFSERRRGGRTGLGIMYNLIHTRQERQQFIHAFPRLALIETSTTPHDVCCYEEGGQQGRRRAGFDGGAGERCYTTSVSCSASLGLETDNDACDGSSSPLVGSTWPSRGVQLHPAPVRFNLAESSLLNPARQPLNSTDLPRHNSPIMKRGITPKGNRLSKTRSSNFPLTELGEAKRTKEFVCLGWEGPDSGLGLG